MGKKTLNFKMSRGSSKNWDVISCSVQCLQMTLDCTGSAFLRMMMWCFFLLWLPANTVGLKCVGVAIETI